MSIFEKVFRALNKAKIKYLVVGGVAVNLYGYMRFTADLDLLVFLEEKNLKRLDKLMKELDYLERIPVSIVELKDNAQVKKWIKEKNFLAYTYTPSNHNPLQIDILTEESLNFEKADAKKVIKKIDNVRIPVVCIDDLIKMKRKAAREKDLLDLEALIKLKNDL